MVGILPPLNASGASMWLGVASGLVFGFALFTLPMVRIGNNLQSQQSTGSSSLMGA